MQLFYTPSCCLLLPTQVIFRKPLDVCSISIVAFFPISAFKKAISYYVIKILLHFFFTTILFLVFDDGDITTLRRTALCLKSGRHFNESETLDQLPLTHPEHFGNPVVGGRRGRRSRQMK